MDFEDLSRQRIDYSLGPNGETVAILTLTLSDGSTHRYSASAGEEDVRQLAAAFAANEVRAGQAIGETYTDEQIEGLFGSIWNGVKKVGNVAAKIATSKVFKYAAAGLATIAPALGPLAPIALGVAGGMAGASALAKAALAAQAGANKTAKTLTRYARYTIRKTSGSKSKATNKTLLRIANRKRKSALRFASRFGKKKTSRRRRPTTRRRRSTSASRRRAAAQRAAMRRRTASRRRKTTPTRRRTTTRRRTYLPTRTTAQPVTAAKAGKLRSNKQGNVTASSLARAARAGRVYWISA